MNEHIKPFLTYLYSFTFIPVYYYYKNKLAFSLPASGITYAPLDKYIHTFLSSDHTISYQLTDFGGLYGYIKDKKQNGFYIIGPISSVKYDNSALFSIRQEYSVPKSDQEQLQQFFYQIPQMNHNEFMALLSFISYSANLENHIPYELTASSIPAFEDDVQKKYTNLQYINKESSYENNSLQIEDLLYGFIEAGDEPGLKQFFTSSYKIDSGIIANSPLRNQKNIMIVSVALCCRAAIRGGLPSDLAFHMSDAYIQLLENQSSIEAILSLGSKMLADFTHRVSENSANTNGDPIIQKAIKFIQHNTNQHITVSDIAKHVNLSRGYLSTLFKKELDFDISAFIKRCKLEEGRELLLIPTKVFPRLAPIYAFPVRAIFRTALKTNIK